jgi:hypothetical protein
MIFAMAEPCRHDQQAVCPNCRGFADLLADFAQNRLPPAFAEQGGARASWPSAEQKSWLAAKLKPRNS